LFGLALNKHCIDVVHPVVIAQSTIESADPNIKLRSRRAWGCVGAILVFVFLAWIGLYASCDAYQAHGRAMADKSCRRIIDLAVQGRLDVAVKEGIITPETLEVFKSVGDHSAKFTTCSYQFEAIQISGMPCVMSINASQGASQFRFELGFTDRYCEGAVQDKYWPPKKTGPKAK